MSSGVVSWFSAQKGYGFIHDNESDNDIFVHFSAISKDGFKTLNEGDKVTYDIEPDPNNGSKQRAINVNVQE
ncbi:MAG: cold-shock protein [Anaerovoracaceae bacterium]